MNKFLMAPALAAALLSGAALPAIAATEAPSLDAVAATTGLGAVLRVPLNNGITLRIGSGSASLGRDFTSEAQTSDSDVHFAAHAQANIKSNSFAIEHMSRSGIGFVAGVYSNNNAVHAVGVPTDATVVINGTSYAQSMAGNVFTDIRWNPVAPYLAMRLAPRKLHGAFLELGAFYQGDAQVSFSATGEIAANQDRFQSYYDQETQRLKHDLAPLRFYPVVQVGMPVYRH